MLESCKLVLFRLCEVFFFPSHLKCIFLGGFWECITKLLAWLSQGSSCCCAATENVVEEEAALLSSCNRHSCRRSETSWFRILTELDPVSLSKAHLVFSLTWKLCCACAEARSPEMQSFCKMPVCYCWENYQESRSKCCLSSPMREARLCLVTLYIWDLCLAIWVLQELSDSLLLPLLLWFGWNHLPSPHSGIVLVQVTFPCASISCLALWTRVAQSALCDVCALCHGLGPCLPWSGSAGEFLQLTQGRSWVKVETGCSWLQPAPEVLEFFCANEQSFSS